MKVTLESTTKVVTLLVDKAYVPARLWEGETASGIKCHAYITRIACEENANAAEFERDLLAQKPPSAAVESIPFGLIL